MFNVEGLGTASDGGLVQDSAQEVSESIFDVPGLWKPRGISAER
jgi:hypothetical protein